MVDRHKARCMCLLSVPRSQDEVMVHTLVFDLELDQSGVELILPALSRGRVDRYATVHPSEIVNYSKSTWVSHLIFLLLQLERNTWCWVMHFGCYVPSYLTNSRIFKPKSLFSSDHTPSQSHHGRGSQKQNYASKSPPMKNHL